MKLLWKLLKKNINKSQIIGFSLANLLGVVILLLGVQFYIDTQTIFNQSDSFMKNDYLIVAKKVSLLGSFISSNNTFDDKEIAKIESKSFVKSVGRFKSSDFRVYASIGIGDTGISSDFFFESVPNEYIDIDLTEWSFEEGDTDIPIIIPRNYLNLYNFGFSQSRNLPKLSESVISQVKFDIRLIGKGSSDIFKGQIIGFSNRLNTILVPESFMSWANNNFSTKENTEPSRLIIEVSNSSDKEMLTYFKDVNYDIEGNALNNGEMAYIARIVTIIVLCIGFIVTLLSIYILILSLFILLEKNSSKIETLILIGYSPWRITMLYNAFVGAVNLVIILSSIIIAVLLRGVYTELLSDLYTFSNTNIMTILSSCVVIYVTISIINFIVIRRRIRSILP
ncbi:MAG: ABC transporter permease [Rikenellaceae bacterium]